MPTFKVSQCHFPQSVAALQQTALAMALFPGSFGLEGATANRVLVSWYTATWMNQRIRW